MAVATPRVLRLVRTISWPSYRENPARLLLVIGGIAVGVALFAAIGLINASVLANFRTMLERTAGKAALQVELGTGEIGFDAATVDLATANGDVANAFGMVRGTLHSVDAHDVLQLFGVDLLSDAMESYDVRVVGGASPVELLNGKNNVLLSEEYAARRNIGPGSPLRVATPTGIVDLNVRGLLQSTGLATVFGGNLAVMDIVAAQKLMGKERRLDQIDLVLKPGASVAAVQRQLAGVLSSSLSVNRPALRGERIERAVAAFQAMLDGISLLCLLASVFIVYNTTATAITERARDLAVLRVVGIEPWRVFFLVIAEAAVLGALASILGIILGVLLAPVLTSMVAESMGAIYQVRFPVETLHLSSSQITWAILLGMFAALAAAILPARKASRLDPIALMRPDYRDQLAVRSSNWQLLVVGSAVAAASVLAVVIEQTQRSIAWSNAGAMLWWLAGLVLSIPAMSVIAKICQRPLAKLFGGAGRIAAAGLLRAPGRTGVTVGVIALSLTVAIGLASAARSFRESQRHLITLVGDLVVSAVGTEGGWLESPLTADVGEKLSVVPGVARVETYRALQGQVFPPPPGRDVPEARIAVVAVSPGFFGPTQWQRMVVAGNPAAAAEDLRMDRAVLVSDNLAEQFALKPGDDITVPAPSGPVSLHIAAVITNDFSGDRGSIIMNQNRFIGAWRDSQVSHFNVFLSSGEDIDAVKQAIEQALHDSYLVKVLTLPRLVEYHQQMIDRAFAFTYAIQLLVIVVTLAGIVDLLTTQIIERRREIGLLQVIGAEPGMVARTIWLEALVIGLSGAVLGALISIGTSYLWVHFNFRILIGYVVEHHFAGFTAAWCVLLAGGVAMLAGRLAAQRALRQPVLETLRYE